MPAPIPDCEEVIRLMSVPDHEKTFIIGSFASYVTVYSQQVRALNLVYSLLRTGKLDGRSNIAVIGGGAAGLTVAVASARLGCSVTLLEKLHAPMATQRGSKKRFLHPHLYDWPNMEFEGNDARLPVLNWSADYADTVAGRMNAQWDKEVLRYGPKLIPHWEATDVWVDLETDTHPITITWNDSERGPQGGEYDIVIFAVGFGLESDPDGSQHRYWEDDRLDKIGSAKRTCLVSGCGDGGLTDLMQLCLKDFQHQRVLSFFVKDAYLREIGATMAAFESDPQNSADERSIARRYMDLKVEYARELLDHQRLLRHDTEVFLTARNWWQVYGGRSSILNRFIVSQLALVKAWKWVPGPLNEPFRRDPHGKYMVSLGTKGQEKAYDILVMRHGPTSSLMEGFPYIWEKCSGLREEWRKLSPRRDPTRKRLSWDDVFDLQDIISVSDPGTVRAKNVRLVAFDLDGTLLRGDQYIWSWKLVWHYLKYSDSVRSKIMAKYTNVRKHESTSWYQEWCDESAKLFRAKALKRSDFTEMTANIRPVDGLMETLYMLQAANIKTAIISGGIDTFLDEKIPGYESLFDHIFINRFIFDESGLFSRIETTKYDFEGKWDAIEEICEREQITAEQVVFVGDGFNDEHVLGRAGFTIGFNASSVQMSENTDVSIRDGDLKKILEYILPSTQ